ncbi:uracil-DNA glycosylase [Metallosphaera tengchongensis]|uniref:Type-5 uracil-DNA glycosylase n=1 Tax=Metallosphaera tengchongensis TaxID=1532350 RepID=A0A6N0NZ54_9CREN|nr:uracil-DNA glycosylase [Metallosphaera tengchongensis]QKR00648.1 uracil-DNA glycosylase [Metallosphaera tengchongensis]
MESFVNRLVSCRKCHRLVQYRESFPQGYWRRPVPPNGDPFSRIALVGLAPAGHGGNRTGRMFTGDRSANNLTRALHDTGLANKPTSESRDDGLVLKVYITSAVKCAPPENRPTRQEIENCLEYLKEEITLLKNVRVYVALGKLAWDSLLDAFRGLGYVVPSAKFSHGAQVLINGVWVLGSYHPSPRNVNTGRLTNEMLVKVLERAKELAYGS